MKGIVIQIASKISSVKKAEFLYGLCVLAAVCCYMLLTVHNIHAPGLHYDEMLFGNAALGGIDGTFITLSFNNIPILLMPYIGALKAYLYYPIFQIFGVSYETIRIPMIMLTGVSFVILYASLRRITSVSIALLTVVLLAVDPSLIAHTRTDVGPTAIEFFCRVLALFGYITFIRTKKTLYCIVFFAALMLGIFNKLNFIWSVNAFVAVGFLIHRRIWLAYFASLAVKGRVLLGAAFTLPFVYFIVLVTSYNIHEIQYSTLNFAEHVKQQVTLLELVVNGTGLYQWIFRTPLEMQVKASPYVLFLVMAGGGYALLDKKLRGNFITFSIFFLVMFVQILLTRSATAPWHTMSVYPFLTVLIALSIQALAQALPKKAAIYSTAFCAVLLVPIIVLNLRVLSLYSQRYQEPVGNPFWSQKIDQLIQFTQNNPQHFVSVDWGIHAQLLVINGDARFHDHWGVLSQLTTSEQRRTYFITFLDPLIEHQDMYFVAHADSQTAFPKAKTNLIQMAHENNFILEKTYEITEKNIVLFEIYKPILKITPEN